MPPEAPKGVRNDFWLIAPYGWGSADNMIRIQKSEAPTALKALNLCSTSRELSGEGHTLAEEMQHHGADSVFVYDCKEVGEYQHAAWTKVK